MHILEIPSFFPPHGGLFCLDQAKAMKARGHEVRILSCVSLAVTVDRKFFFTARRDYWQEEMDGVEAFRHYQRDIPKWVYGNAARWLRTVNNMYEAYKERYGKPDVIHAHCCKYAGIAAHIISIKDNIPYFITEHISYGLFVKDFGDGWKYHKWLRCMMQETYMNAACVIPVSEELVDRLAPLFGKEYSYKVISNIVDTDFFTFREREPLSNRKFLFCCLAIADIYGKGYDVLSEVWKNISNAELHIAGRGTDCDKMRDLFCGFDNVKLYGHLDKTCVRELLYKCDALVLPSRSEAQPLVILEALSTGIPVVTTDCVPQSVRIKDACFIAKVGDATTLLREMTRVMTSCPSKKYSDVVRVMASPTNVALQLEHIMGGKR